mmetsp:Transcript_9554/g.21925  ORF Transcript_9554/g.21925 Transcript_9554/m.21925 type:complete len:214 (+) Transcript_9554:393-1034(+)
MVHKTSRPTWKGFTRATSNHGAILLERGVRAGGVAHEICSRCYRCATGVDQLFHRRVIRSEVRFIGQCRIAKITKIRLARIGTNIANGRTTDIDKIGITHIDTCTDKRFARVASHIQFCHVCPRCIVTDIDQRWFTGWCICGFACTALYRCRCIETHKSLTSLGCIHVLNRNTRGRIDRHDRLVRPGRILRFIPNPFGRGGHDRCWLCVLCSG